MDEKLPKAKVDKIEDDSHKQKHVVSFSTTQNSIETDEAQLESHSNSEIKPISDLEEQVSKKTGKKPYLLIQDIKIGGIRVNRSWTQFYNQ